MGQSKKYMKSRIIVGSMVEVEMPGNFIPKGGSLDNCLAVDWSTRQLMVHEIRECPDGFCTLEGPVTIYFCDCGPEIYPFSLDRKNAEMWSCRLGTASSLPIFSAYGCMGTIVKVIW